MSVIEKSSQNIRSVIVLGQKTPHPNNTVGSAATWMPCGKLVWGGTFVCKCIIARGFLCSESMYGATQLELFYTAVPFNTFVWWYVMTETLLRETQG